MNLLKILLVLGVALFILVPLLQHLSKGQDQAKFAALGKWLFPLVALTLVLQLFFFYLR